MNNSSVCKRLAAALWVAIVLGVSPTVLAQGVAAPGVQPLDLRLAPPPRDGSPALPVDSTRSAAATPNLAAPYVTLGKDYRVGPNDLMDVEVLELESPKRTVRVNAAGAISLPLIGLVTVAGRTAQEIEALVADRYREKYLQNPQVSVFIKEFTTERITVEGAVAKPGIFPLTGQITLLRALAMAGGFGPIADPTQVMLFRTNEQRVREVLVFNVEQIRAGKDNDPVILGDDLIVVQQNSARKFLRDSVFRDFLDSINPFSVLR